MSDSQESSQARAVWTKGNYGRLAERLSPAAKQIAVAAGVGGGRRVLDIATGTGSLAISLAKRRWRVTGTDIAANLLVEAAARAKSSDVNIELHEAPIDAQPFDTHTFDLVCSSFGLIFSWDPPRALTEVGRVLVPGGTLVYSAWTPRSYIADMTRTMQQHMPSESNLGNPFRWGNPATTAHWLEEAGLDHVTTTTHHLPWQFDNAAQATDFLFENSPGHVAALTATGNNAHTLRTTVTDHLTAWAEPDGSIDISAEYIVTVAQTRAQADRKTH